MEILRMPADPDEWLETAEHEIERIEQAADELCCMMFGQVAYLATLPIREYTPACAPVAMMEGG